MIPEHQQINLIAGQHCQYFIVSQPENAIYDNQQIDPLAVRHSPYMNVLELEKRIIE